MTWVRVARKDFADASRSRLLWALVGLLVLSVGGLVAVPYLVADDPTTPTFEDGMSSLYVPIGTLVPIIALVVGYRSVVGERASGTIRVLLGLPITRRDVILGKVVGRAAVVAVPTVVGFGAAAIVAAVVYEGFDTFAYLTLFGYTLFLGLLYVAIAVGISASVNSRAKALAVAVGFYVTSEVLWDFVPMSLYWVLEREFPDFDALPAWYVFVDRLSPDESLNVVLVTLADFLAPEGYDPTAEGRIAGEAPFFVETWFVPVIVGLWVAVPLAVGYLRFRRATLS